MGRVPGFIVRELPLEVNNVNNLVFAPDGRLFALCYDGNVLQLEDRDGDGLEETATYFYKNDKNEILPSIGMCWGPGLRRAEVSAEGSESPRRRADAGAERHRASATQAGGLFIASQRRVIHLRDQGDATAELMTVTSPVR